MLTTSAVAKPNRYTSNRRLKTTCHRSLLSLARVNPVTNKKNATPSCFVLMGGMVLRGAAVATWP